MQGSQGTNSQTQAIAYDLLIGSKNGIASIAKAATEASNTQLRIFLNEAMTESIQEHFTLADMLVSQGLYQPLNVQQQLQQDLTASQRLTQQSHGNYQSSKNQTRTSSSQGNEEFGSELTAQSADYSSDSQTNQSQYSASANTSTHSPQSSSFERSTTLGNSSPTEYSNHTYISGLPNQNNSSQLQANQLQQGQAVASTSPNTQSQSSNSSAMEEYSSELQGRTPSKAKSTTGINSSTASNDSQQRSSSTQQSQKQSPNLPYSTMLAPHEVLELHELVRTDAICLKKLETGVSMVQDSALKSLMQNSSQQKRQFLDDAGTFFQRSTYTDVH